APRPVTPPPASAPQQRELDGLYPCPYCGERIRKDSRRCRHCDEEIEGLPERDEDDEESDERPWEREHPAFVRRDCEPHRGNLILTLGIVSLVLLAFCGPLGLPIGICAWVMGGRDLRKMKNKEMDPQGQGQTQAGWICGIVGTILDSLALLACLGYFGFIGYMIQSTASNVQTARTIQQQ